MKNYTAIQRFLLLTILISGAAGLAAADTLYRIPVEHNHRQGECQGMLIVRDDKVVFESSHPGCGRVMEYAGIRRIETKHGYEFDVYFADAANGKDQKYVLKFKNDQPENQAALDYIRQHMGSGAPAPAGVETGGSEPMTLPYRFGVELDLNGSNCNGTLILREDKILFETGAVQCGDRAFAREWDTLKEYRRVGDTEFMLIFYKYGRTSPDKTTTLRFWSKKGPIPPDVERMLQERAR